jgi:cytochrome b561
MTRPLAHLMPHRRTALKLMHWTIAPLVVWFVVVTPDVAFRLGGQRFFLLHSNLALLFVSLCLAWTADYLRRGLASRPGPKLPPWARRVHGLMHRTLVWGLFTVALTGFLLGLTSARLLRAGGFLPIAPPLDLPLLNDWIGTVHVAQFYLLAALALGHAAFHLWRHYGLRDNALRIMAPRALYRYL